MSLALVPSASMGTPTWFDRSTAVMTTANVDGSLYSSAPDGQNGLFVGGDFRSFGGVARAYLVRLGLDGGVMNWGPVLDGPVTSLHLAGPVLYVGGTFLHVDGQVRTRLAALDASTGALLPWAPSANQQVNAILRLGDRVFVGGNFNAVNGVNAIGIAALDPTTGALLPFQSDVQFEVLALAGRDSVLYVGLSSTSAYSALKAFRASTGERLGFPIAMGGSYPRVWTLSLVGDRLLVGGLFTILQNSSRRDLGAVDLRLGQVSDWDPGGAEVQSLAVTGDTVVVGTRAALVGGANRSGVAMLDLASGRALSWAPDCSAGSRTTFVAVLGSRILADGSLAASGGRSPPNPVSLLPEYPQLDGAVLASSSVGDTLYVGGAFQQAGSPWGPVVRSPRRGLAAVRWSSGEVLGAFGALEGNVSALEPYGSDLLVGGAFAAYAQSTILRTLARVDRTTGQWRPWVSGLNGFVCDIEVVRDTAYVVGDFSLAGGTIRHAACAFDLRTGLLTDWNPDLLPGPVYRIRYDGERFWVGGTIWTARGATAGHLLQVDPRTGAATPWDATMPGGVHDIRIEGDVVRATGDFGGRAWSRSSHQRLPWSPGSSVAVPTLEPWGSGHLLSLTDWRGSRLVWADGGTGSELQDLGAWNDAGISTLALHEDRIAFGGAFARLAVGPDHGYFGVTRAPSLPTAVESFLAEGSVVDGKARLRAFVGPGERITLQRRNLPAHGWNAPEVERVDDREATWFVDPSVEPGERYTYRLEIGSNGVVTYSPEIQIQVPAIAVLDVGAPLPNPSVGAPRLQLRAPAGTGVEVELFDVRGRRIETGRIEFATSWEQSWQPRVVLAPGLYLVRIAAGGRHVTRRFVVVH